MIISDLVALAKQGFTPADVKELLKMDNSHDDSAEDPISTENGSDQKTVQKDDQQDAEQVDDGDAIDYKTKYEDLKGKIEKLEHDLQAAQSNNVRTDISDHTEVDYEKQIQDLARSFM